MPNNPSSEPLRRVTLNLYEADCQALEAEHGHGWTGEVREQVRKHVRRKPTVEEFLNQQGYGKAPYRGH